MSSAGIGEANASGAVIKVKDLRKVFEGDLRAVDGVSFEVGRGEVFGFLGPNGAGKTTTISILTTLMLPTGGEASILGDNIVEEPDKVRKNIGLVPQDLTSDDQLTGRENMELQARLYGMRPSESKKRIDDLLKLVGLTDAQNRIVKNYSGGMKKRLELANGLVHRPKILFLDEPTLGLDIQTRTSIWEHIRKLRAETSMTIFLTTHYLEEADGLCDRIAIIDHGKIIALDTPQGLKSSVGGDVIELEAEKCDVDLLELVRSINGVTLIDGKCDGNKVRVKVSNSSESLPKVLQTLWKNNITVTNVGVKKPSLDQAFLEYTGRELRDEEQSTGGRPVPSRRGGARR